MIPLTTVSLHDGTQLWPISTVCAHVGVAKATYTSYVSKGFAPAPTHQIENTRLWDAGEVKAWHAARPGSPVPNAPGSSR